ncbi:MAG: phosphoribosyl-AMP cyclohydrolase [Hydrogenovibrio crunogenus]|uniref:Phosphoribosyl-AMP cyclohydrolase n=1 Tax=Hydrogenovibrio crunogenus (strain DSM 25203 / XCL-2) TaxID=317025 RepID=HIS3_HYDCU|nr:RecName: Full=Phosphoribosyl-AMP cyclohydrolase; Short=PRA-CH [Hydrogenovibrio crunogenus XCL-2]MBD3611359.1 phosphoribosyl-AMP cyclohydrolase [Hydrogenovibrio crunogenus]
MSQQLTFKQLEKAQQGDSFDWEAVKKQVKYDDNGLIPAIAQQFDSKEVLMMAWMNEAALQETLETGRVCYWSRSRQSYWRKGEESGQIQLLKDLRFDCDGDAILLLVDQTGPACHTGRKSCFYTAIHDHQAKILTNPIIDPEALYKK